MSASRHIGSRYNIKYHEETERCSTYLSGATIGDNQTIYAKLVKFLTYYRDYDLVKYYENDDTYQNIMTSLLKLRLELYNNRVNVIATLNDDIDEKYRDEVTEAFYRIGNTTDLVLGSLPEDKNFAVAIWGNYIHAQSVSNISPIALSSVKFNAWGEKYILLRVSVQLIDVIFTYENGKILLPSKEDTVIDDQTIESSVSIIKPVKRTVAKQRVSSKTLLPYTTVQKYSSTLETFEEAIEYLQAHLMTMYFIKEMSK